MQFGATDEAHIIRTIEYTADLQEVRMKTSEYLTHYLKDADDNFHEDVPDAEPHEHPSIFAENIVRLLLDTLEGVVPTGSPIPKVLDHLDPAVLEDWFDDLYARRMLKEVPRMARRTVRLAPVIGESTLQDRTIHYLKEATRSYIFGFPTACIALSRAAVEQALKDRLDKTDGESTTYGGLVQEAIRRRFLDLSAETLANQVQFEGNRWLHGSFDDQTNTVAWDTLCSARGVISALFKPVE